jgi:hypothetical protein
VDIAAGRYLDLWRFGLSEREPAVRALAVVVVDVDPHNVLEVAAADDQEPVETLIADGADEPFRVGVRLWCLRRRVDDLDSPLPSTRCSAAKVNLLSRSWIRKRIRSRTLVKLRLRACWTTQLPDGLVVQPAKWTRLLPSSMKKRTYRRRRATVSTVKKSQASRLAAWRRRNAGQLTAPRRGAGSSPAAASRRRTVLGEIRKPSLSSSPAIR